MQPGRLAPDTADPSLPAHVAIIMDGNGRWAAGRGLPRVAGHRAGAQAVRRTIEAAIGARVGWLTLYAFSSENWSRPPSEVLDLTGLLRHYLRQELAELTAQGVRLRVIGDRTRFDADICADLDHAERQTAGNARLNLNVALSYGARAEIVAAARRAAEAVRAGTLDPAALDEATFASFLSTSGMPDPDLLIRTSGEHRLSNFLLWQSAYAELVFTDVLWPDFGAAEWEAALAEFAGESAGSGLALAEPHSVKPGTRWADLRLRVVSAAVLVPIVLACVWFGGLLFAVLLLAGFAGVVWEWGIMCRWRVVPLVPGILYALLAVCSLVVWRSVGDARAIYFILAAVWCSDIGAYAVGRTVGGPRLAPRVSPGKTWSGAAGGLVAAVVGGCLVAGNFELPVIGAAALLGVASQLGDLGESALKRAYDVKDSGRLLPGHGGLLDRLDGLMAASVVAGVVILFAAQAPK